VNPTLTIVGASVRAAAQSAARAGYRVKAGDLFADRDLLRIARATRVADYPQGLLRVVAGSQPGGWMYTGALENHPDLVDRMAALRPLLGNSGTVLRAVRDPRRLHQSLRSSGLPAPLVVMAGDPTPTSGPWLRKPLASAGGVEIDLWDGRAPVEAAEYLQELVAGDPYSATFIADGRRAVLVGVTRQLVGRAECGAAGFRYCGSLGPIPLSASLRDAFAAVGDTLASNFSLRGLFGVDVVVNDGGVWPIEVNPRYTASVEILERARGVSLIPAHIEACEQSVLAEWSESSCDRVSGKVILFARSDCVAGEWPQRLASQSQPDWADLPEPGSAIKRGWPILTLLRDGTDASHVLAQLDEDARAVYANWR